jgi:hypothetical protein
MVRKTLQGSRREVLHLSAKAVIDSAEQGETPARADAKVVASAEASDAYKPAVPTA